MEYIRVTKENLEKEHICCAISSNNDVQVSSKKAWLADRFDDGLSGFPVLLKDTDIPMICWVHVLMTARKKAGRDCAFCPPRKRDHSLPILNISSTRDLPCVMRQITVSSFGISRSHRIRNRPDSKIVQSILISKKMAMSFTTRTSALSMRNMYRSSNKRQKSMGSHSEPFILKAGKQPEAPPLLLRRMRCSAMENM